MNLQNARSNNKERVQLFKTSVDPIMFQNSYVPVPEFHATEVYFTKLEIKESKRGTALNIKDISVNTSIFYYKSSICPNEMHFINQNIVFITKDNGHCQVLTLCSLFRRLF